MIAISRSFSVNSRKFDGTLRRSWKCEFVSASDTSVDLVGIFEQVVQHPDLGTIDAGTISFERFYFRRWYNYFIFQQPDGTLRNYYINICMPPEITSDSVDYVDLDIDLIVWPDGSWQTLDLDEFEENTLAFRYPEAVVKKALTTLADLQRMLQTSEARPLDIRLAI